jgi:hypothetical protein
VDEHTEHLFEIEDRAPRHAGRWQYDLSCRDHEPGGGPMEPTVHLTLAEEGSDQTRLDQLHRQLRDELRQLEVVDVRLGTSHPAPPGARGVDAATVSTLAVALMGSGGLTAVITAVRAWLDRGHEAPRSIRLEVDGDVLELSGATNAEHDRLVSLFLDRHAGKAPSWTADAQP